MKNQKTSDSEPKKRKLTRASLSNAFKLYQYIKPYRVEYGIGMVFLFGSSAASLAFPKLLGDLVTSGNNGSLSQDLNRIALLLVALLIVQSIFSYFRTVLFVNVTEKTLAYLRQSTYNHLIKLPIRFFEQHRVGELNSRISSDVTLLQETLTTTLAEFIRQVIIIVGGITLLVFTSVKLTLFMLAILPPTIIMVYFFGRFIRKFSKTVQKEVANSNTIVEETLQGIQIVKTYTNEFFEMARYREKTSEIAKIGMKSGRYRGAFSAFIILGLFGAMVAVIWRGSILLAQGTIDAGQLFSFVIYSGFIGGTIGGLASVIAQIQRFIGATEDLFEIFKVEQEPVSDTSEMPISETIRGNIEFRDISFAYPSRPDSGVLKGISVSIPENSLVALVGPSGAGKSTFASLLLHLHLPDDGFILLDGKNSRDFPVSWLRRQIALVPQDVFLFGGSIRENIAYGKPGATDVEIIEAARQANALDFIEQFPEKMETIVGERGTQLSGGQRQRIAIARALLKDPRILILDEATSSLDSESERLVQDALEKLMKGRTSIVIAHRLSTIRKADMILVLNKGVLAEKGTHDELMMLPNGIYRNLNQLQYGSQYESVG
jgi:ABC-type multidrug transport system fused ATPase/permease subunit